MATHREYRAGSGAYDAFGHASQYQMRHAMAAVRADIDRLVTEALVIELGRSRGGPEPQDAIAATRADWELVKSQWR